MKVPSLKLICGTIGCVLSAYAVLLALRPATTQPTQIRSRKRREFSRVNFTFVRPTFTPKLEDNELSPFVLIIVSSAAWTDFKFRRNAVRETWGRSGERQQLPSELRIENELASITASKAVPDPVSWKTVFLFGKTRDETLDSRVMNEGAEHNDIVIGNFTEDYDNLVIKVFMGLAWGLTVRCRYILKADDDVYIRVPRILEWLTDAPVHLYAGHVHKDVQVNHDPSDSTSIAIDPQIYEEEVFPPYCLGAFYIVSTSILPGIFDAVKLRRPWPIEDTYLGVLARQIGVHPVEIDGLLLKSAMGESLDKTDCEMAQSRALGHQLAPSDLYLLHKRFQVLKEKFGGRVCICVKTIKCLLLYLSLAVTLSVIIFVLYLSQLRICRSTVLVSSTNTNKL